MNAEPGKRAGKAKLRPFAKPRRGKEKDDYDWRSDPSKTSQTTSLLSGYKSAKHRWACKYKEQQRREMLASNAANGAQEWSVRESENAYHSTGVSNGIQDQVRAASLRGDATQVTSPEISDIEVRRSNGLAVDSLAGELGEGTESAHGRDADLPKWIRPQISAKPQKGKRGTGAKEKEESIKAATKKERKRAAAELKSEHEDRARRITTASLANESLHKNARKAQKQAETELAEAAEQDRGAQAASSLQRELRNRDGQSMLEDPNSQMLQRSSDNAADSSADVAQGMASETGKKRPDGQQLGHAQGGSDYHGMGKQHPGRNQGNANERPGIGAKWKSKSQTKRKGQRPAAQNHELETADIKAEDTAETQGTGRKRGLRLDNISPIESSKCGAQSLADLVNGVSTAEDTGMLTQVMLVEGDEKEHLGELDLHQLDSFKDLWRTMRAAYARLPKGDLRMVYKDIDNDLMQLQDEPWAYFRSVARGVFLMKAPTPVS